MVLLFLLLYHLVNQILKLSLFKLKAIKLMDECLCFPVDDFVKMELAFLYSIKAATFLKLVKHFAQINIDVIIVLRSSEHAEIACNAFQGDF